jgi:hypothetical protein
MNDVIFLNLAQGLIEFVDENYGRAAAWAVAVLLVSPFVALIIALYISLR